MSGEQQQPAEAEQRVTSWADVGCCAVVCLTVVAVVLICTWGAVNLRG